MLYRIPGRYSRMTLPLVSSGFVQYNAVQSLSASQKKQALANIGEDQRTPNGDSNYTILSTDRIVATSAAFTAPRTWTLPAASAFNPGGRLLVEDSVGGLTSTNTLSVARAGADTINGSSGSVTLNRAYGWVLLESDGVSKWTIIGVSRAKKITVYPSGSGTHTPDALCTEIRARLIAGGGGGAGSGGAAGTAPGAGGNTTFGNLTTNGGAIGGWAGQGGAGGGVTIGSGWAGIGQTGGNGGAVAGFTQIDINGGQGGAGAFGSGGQGAARQSPPANAANTGAGGGGAGGTVSSTFGGGGGGSGGYIDAVTTGTVAASYAYAVGAGGTAGAAGTSGQAGGAGSSGYIEVEEDFR